MENVAKITVQIPTPLLRRAVAATGLGITPTVRRGLELVATGKTYDRLRRLKGKVKFSLDLKTLREDR